MKESQRNPQDGAPPKLGKVGKSLIGQSVIREDAIPKVTGKAVYAADIKRRGMLHAKVLLSPHPHALIRRIDTQKARSMPGVHAVLTAADIPGTNSFGIAIPDQQVLADEKVRFIGESVAVVAAEDPALAQEAIQQIDVEYEELPSVFDPIDALKPMAPRVHADGNLVLHTKVRKGDLTEGFDRADLIIDNVYETHSQDHACLERENGIGWVDPDGTLSIHSPTQYAFRDRRQIARVVNIPINRIRVASTTVGGGFGRKDDVTVEILIALLCLSTGRPVRLEYSRHESMLTQTHRHPTIMRLKTGVTKDGDLTAFEGVVYGDTGAYSSLGIYVIKKMALHLGGAVPLPKLQGR